MRTSQHTSDQTNHHWKRVSPWGVLGLAFGLAAASAVACGVSGGGGGSTTGAAGTPSTGSAGTTSSPGTAGSTGSAAGTTGSGAVAGTGMAGAPDTTGAAGTGATGAAGTTGSAGSGTGAAGVTGEAGSTGAGGAATGAGGSPPLSGITINIGGTNVPKENAIAFLHFGHSNMAGRGVDLPATRPFFFGATDPHAWMYHSGKGFEAAIEPKTAGDGGNTINGMTSGGPGTALVKEAAALAPDKYFISVGYGQSSAYCSQFLPGALYYNDVMAGAMELKGKVTWAGIMIYLGITERHGTTADVNNYPQCINQLVTQIRKDLGEPNLPLIINDYEANTTGPLAVGSSFYNAIHPKQLMLPTVVANSVLIPTTTCAIQDDHSTTDDHHFSLDGHKEYVRLMLATMQQKGWFPWK